MSTTTAPPVQPPKATQDDSIPSMVNPIASPLLQIIRKDCQKEPPKTEKTGKTNTSEETLLRTEAVQPAYKLTQAVPERIGSPNIDGDAVKTKREKDSGTNKATKSQTDTVADHSRVIFRRASPEMVHIPNSDGYFQKVRRGGKLFQCQGFGDCRMCFSRSEHLARHIRKHTGERTFQCRCGRSFSRLDNLRQHVYAVHAGESQNYQTIKQNFVPENGQSQAEEVAISKPGSEHNRRRNKSGEVKSASPKSPSLSPPVPKQREIEIRTGLNTNTGGFDSLINGIHVNSRHSSSNASISSVTSIDEKPVTPVANSQPVPATNGAVPPIMIPVDGKYHYPPVVYPPRAFHYPLYNGVPVSHSPQYSPYAMQQQVAPPLPTPPQLTPPLSAGLPPYASDADADQGKVLPENNSSYSKPPVMSMQSHYSAPAQQHQANQAPAQQPIVQQPSFQQPPAQQLPVQQPPIHHLPVHQPSIHQPAPGASETPQAPQAPHPPHLIHAHLPATGPPPAPFYNSGMVLMPQGPPGYQMVYPPHEHGFAYSYPAVML